MARRKTIRSTIILLTLFLMLFFIVGGIGLFFILSRGQQGFIENTSDGSTIRANFYDIHGAKIGRISQKTIGTTPGVFYIGFDLKVENMGDVDLTSVQATETHSTDLTTALTDEALNIPTLTTTDGQVTLGTSTNSCFNDDDCASNEKCLQLQCLIDISAFPLGVTNFGFTAEANFIDAVGTQLSTTTGSVNLPLDFQEDGILLRFEKSRLGALSTFTDSWIVADANLDGTFETYGGAGSVAQGADGGDFDGICALSGDPDFISFYGNLVVQKSTNTDKIYLCDDLTIDDWIVFHKNDADRCDSSHPDFPGCQSITPTEPWFSSLCIAALPPLPCQEVYILFITAETCTDTIKNQDETDVDCGGATCAACSNGQACLIDNDCGTGLSCVSLTCQPALPTPFASYNLDNNVLDQTGTYDGVISGAVDCSVAGRLANACHFDGVSSEIDITDDSIFSPVTTGGFTVAAWVKADTFDFVASDLSGLNALHFLSKGQPSQHEWAFRMYNASAFDGVPRPKRISFYTFALAGGIGSGSFFQDPLVDGEWFHVVGMVDGSNAKIYKNGVLRDTDPILITLGDGIAPVRIGRRTGEPLEGSIDEVKFYDFALTDTEVADLYNTYSQSCSDMTHNQAENCADIGGSCGGFESGSELSCSDGKDNDCDGFIDAQDSDCSMSRPRANVLSFSFEEAITGSGQTIIDKATNVNYQNDGTSQLSLTCGPASPGQIEDACTYDTNGYISMSTGNIPARRGTITQWIKTTNNAAHGVLVYLSDGTSGSYNGFGENVPIFEMHTAIDVDGTAFFVYQDGSSSSPDQSSFMRSTTILQNNQWYFLAATYDVDGFGRLYLGTPSISPVEEDAENMGSLAYAGRIPTIARIGRPGEGIREWTGTIDEVNVFDYVLTPAQIQKVWDGTWTTADESCFDLGWNQDEVCADIGGVCGGLQANEVGLCSDGLDNDCDGFVDSIDSDCPSLSCFGTPHACSVFTSKNSCNNHGNGCTWVGGGTKECQGTHNACTTYGSSATCTPHSCTWGFA